LDTKQLFKDCRSQLKAGDANDGMRRLQDAIRRGELSPEQYERAGRLIASHLSSGRVADTPGDAAATRVRLLGQCTTSWLVPSLTAAAWGEGMALGVDEAEYDNVVQDLMAAGDLSATIAVLVPWNRALLADAAGPMEGRVEAELETWRIAWQVLSERGASRIIQVGYDWVTPGALGGHLGALAGDVAIVRRMNERLREALPESAVFVDLAEISGQLGRETFYDPRRYHWTKQPFSEAGTVRLAEHLHAAVRALTTGPKKVLVLDLDNTLWGGVVGELGALEIGLGESPEGEAFRAFQAAVVKLARRGIVLAVASKNNLDDAREPFEKNPDMLLALDDFAAFEASWEPKDVALRKIATQLRLGLEDFVFFDDNPAERELIRQSLPEVSVVEVPEEPAEYVRALERGLHFESRSLTAEDWGRTAQYRSERERRSLEGAAPSLDEYLASLEMTGTIRAIDDGDMQRVVQLLGKTNQWNLTTRRLAENQVRSLLEAPGSLGLSLRLADRFGDHGLIAVLLAEREDETLRISDWLMSCRVIGRTAEQFIFLHLLGLAREAGVAKVEGEYIATKKNNMVAELFVDLGFEPIAEEGSSRRFSLPLSAPPSLETFVRPV